MKQFLTLALFLFIYLISIKAQTATNISVLDTRSVNTAPNGYSKEAKFEFKNCTTIGVPGVGTYSGLLTIAPWGDISGNKVHQLNFNDGGLYWRTGSQSGSWDTWQKILFENTNGFVGIGTTSPSGKLSLVNGALHINTSGNGSSSIDDLSTAIVLGPKASRNTTIGSYYGGLAFNHLLNFSGTTFNSSNHAWIGLRLVATPGSEQSDLIFATKEGTLNTSRPIERMCIKYNGNVGIGTTSPTSKLEVNGDVKINDGTLNMTTSQAFFLANKPIIDIQGFCDDCGSKPMHNLIFDSYNIGIKVVGSKDNLPFNIVGSTSLYMNGYFSNYIDKGNNTYSYNRFEIGKVVTSNDLNAFSFLKDGNGYQSIAAANATFDGKVTAQSIEVKPNVWADDVFIKGYKLLGLMELENYINANNHLPGVPTENQVKQNGINLGEMNVVLLRKIEELTKYIIEQDKAISELKTEMKSLKSK